MKIEHHEFWMVYEDYVIKDDHLCIAGDYRRSYNPVRQQELPAEIAKVPAGNTEALLQFVLNYGMFGYQYLYQPNHDEKPPQHTGEPLPWIWAHMNTIKLCLTLQQYCYEQRQDWEIEDCLDKCRLPLVRRDSNTYEIQVAATGNLDSVCLSRKPQGSIRDVAQRFCHEIIQRNIRGISHELQRLDGKEQPSLVFSSLIEVAYWHLAKTGNKPVKPCDWCGSLFIVQHGRQQYCPHPDPSKESPCSANARQTKRRQAQRVSTP